MLTLGIGCSKDNWPTDNEIGQEIEIVGYLQYADVSKCNLASCQLKNEIEMIIINPYHLKNNLKQWAKRKEMSNRLKKKPFSLSEQELTLWQNAPFAIFAKLSYDLEDEDCQKELNRLKSRVGKTIKIKGVLKEGRKMTIKKPLAKI